MRTFLALIGAVAFVGTASAQTVSPLSDLTGIGAGLGNIGAQVIAIPNRAKPASIPLLTPVACLGNCAATIAAVCRGMGYAGSDVTAMNMPLAGAGLFAAGTCKTAGR